MKLYLKESWKYFVQTLPFLWIKLGISFVMALLFMLLIGIVVLSFIYGGGIVALIVGIIMLIIAIKVGKIIKRYLLYMVKMGHVAAISELVHNGKLPEGQKVVKYGFSKVKENFAQASVFAAIDFIIEKVAKSITRMIERIGNMIPIKQVKTIFHFIAAVINIFLNTIDEAVMSFVFIHPDANPWVGARDGLILYFKKWKTMLPAAVIMGLISWGFSFVIFLIFYMAFSPLGLLISTFNLPLVIALIIVFIIKSAILDQFVLTGMITAYQEAVKDEVVDEESMNKLENFAPKFKKILEKSGREIKHSKPHTVTVAATAPIENDPYLEKLIPFIKNMRAKGYKDEQIKKSLIDNKWPEKSIDKALKKA